MVLNSPLADPKVCSDVFARMAGEDEGHDLGLPWREAFEMVKRRIASLQGFIAPLGHGQGAANAGHKEIVRGRLFDKIHRTFLHRPDGLAHGAAAAQDHDRRARGQLTQLTEKLKPPHARKMDVENDTGVGPPLVMDEKVLARRERINLPAVALEERHKIVSDEIIILNNNYLFVKFYRTFSVPMDVRRLSIPSGRTVTNAKRND